MTPAPSPESFVAQVIRYDTRQAGGQPVYKIATTVVPVVAGVPGPRMGVQIDTASDPQLVLDKAKADALGLTLGPAVAVQGVSGAAARTWLASLDLQFGDIPERFPVRVLVIDLPAGKERRLLGLSALHPAFDFVKAGDVVTFTRVHPPG
jgi:hypothetical protein